MAVDGVSTSTNAFITTVQTEALAVIGYLESYYNGFSQTVLTATTTPTLTNNISGKFTKITDFSTIKTALDAYISDINAIDVSTTIPSPPDLTGFTSAKWSETWWGNLKTEVQRFFTTSTSLTETNAMQDAMYQKDLARRQQTLRDIYSAANSNTAARGFLFPTSLTTALKLDGQQKFQFDAATASRDIYKFVIEWAKSNYQFALDKTITAHNADIEFNIKYMNALVETYRATVLTLLEQYKELVAVAIAKLEAKIKEYQLEVEVAKTNGTLDTEVVKAFLEQYALDIKNHVEVANTQANINLEFTKSKSAAATAALNGLAALSQSVSQILINSYPGTGA